MALNLPFSLMCTFKSVTSFKYADTMYYYIKNLQGDVVKIIDRLGNTKVTYTYDAWGKVLSQTDTSIYNLANLNPFRYRGYAYDNQTGLHYLQSRYYDPITGRFLNADIYADTLSGTPLSTNMFAYCENNAVMKYDTTGQGAWWIQSPNSACYQGHTSLLIQEKPGFWWYFYFGPYSIQLLFIGETTQKDINKNVKKVLNLFKIKLTDSYTRVIKMSGDFKCSLSQVKSCMNYHAKKYNKKILQARNGNQYSYKGKTYTRPKSMVIKGENKDYDTLNYNCLDACVGMLYYGKPTSNQKSFKNDMINIQANYYIPNSAFYDRTLLKYGKRYE